MIYILILPPATSGHMGCYLFLHLRLTNIKSLRLWFSTDINLNNESHRQVACSKQNKSQHLSYLHRHDWDDRSPPCHIAWILVCWCVALACNVMYSSCDILIKGSQFSAYHYCIDYWLSHASSLQIITMAKYYYYSWARYFVSSEYHLKDICV